MFYLQMIMNFYPLSRFLNLSSRMKKRNFHILETNWSKETNDPILESPEYQLLKYTMYRCYNYLRKLQNM